MHHGDISGRRQGEKGDDASQVQPSLPRSLRDMLPASDMFYIERLDWGLILTDPNWLGLSSALNTSCEYVRA